VIVVTTSQNFTNTLKLIFISAFLFANLRGKKLHLFFEIIYDEFASWLQ